MPMQARFIPAALSLALISAASIAAQAPDLQEPATSGGPATFRRLDEAQYANSIADIFGGSIKIPGRFDPPWREDGLLAIGDGKVVVSSSGLEQDELRARNISAQVLAEDHRASVVSCAPQSTVAFDESCASQFIGKYGRLLYRRPLDQEEMLSVMHVARGATKQTGDFNKGLETALARLLASPNFIFRVEHLQADPDTGRTRLDDYSLAARISFLMWNAPPDESLLDAAATGALREKKGLEAQVERLMASPRFEQGMRAFFSDMFAYERFDNLSKDQSLFPIYSSQVAKDAREQALRTTLDLLLTNNGDYRDLFTTKKTFMNRNMGALYGVAVEEGGVGGWAPYTFGADDHRAGLLTLAGFLMLDPSHEGRSSPTIRGKSVREIFLCQKVPAPPGAVDFKLVEDTHNPVNRTARERLTAHRENPVCAGCHSVMDPIGLSMENYDAIGDFRATENGVPIDTSGTFDGKSYKDVIELENLIHDSAGLTNCLARRVYEYGAGRTVTADEKEWLKYLDERFADERYGFPGLLRIVATSRAFQAVSTATTVASN
jgi:hypothetical protein